MQNNIEKIENLECLINLRFLTLSNNAVTALSGLKPLKKLGLLDLSHNRIAVVEVSKYCYNLSGLLLFCFFAEHSQSLNYLLRQVILHKFVVFALDELPPSIIILNFQGNPCVKTSGYRYVFIWSSINCAPLVTINESKINCNQ